MAGHASFDEPHAKMCRADSPAIAPTCISQVLSVWAKSGRATSGLGAPHVTVFSASPSGPNSQSVRKERLHSEGVRVRWGWGGLEPVLWGKERRLPEQMWASRLSDTWQPLMGLGGMHPQVSMSKLWRIAGPSLSRGIPLPKVMSRAAMYTRVDPTFILELAFLRQVTGAFGERRWWPACSASCRRPAARCPSSAGRSPRSPGSSGRRCTRL